MSGRCAPVLVALLGFLRALAQTTAPEISKAIRERDYPRAEQSLIDEYQSHPHSPGTLLLLGAVFFSDRKYLNCASALEKADKAGLLDERSRFTLAMAYVNLSRFDLARPELEKLASISPNNGRNHYWLGRIDFIDQKYQAAIQELNTAAKLDPGFVRTYNVRGLSYEALGQADRALADLRRSVALNRQQPRPSEWPPFDLADQLFKLGQPQEAEALARESLEYEPSFAKAYFEIGLIEEQLGDTQAAVRALRHAIVLDANAPEPYYALSRVLRKTGDTNGARQAAAQFGKLRKQPNELQ